MTATLPNRIADYLTPPRLDVPPTPEGRQELWTTAVFQAVALLQAKLASRDSGVAMEAARLLLDLEKTRMRHARELTGTPERKPATAASADFGGPLPPLEPLDVDLSPDRFPRDEWDDEGESAEPAEPPADEDEPLTFASCRSSPAFMAALTQMQAYLRKFHPDHDWTDERAAEILIDVYKDRRAKAATLWSGHSVTGSTRDTATGNAGKPGTHTDRTGPASGHGVTGPRETRSAVDARCPPYL